MKLMAKLPGMKRTARVFFFPTGCLCLVGVFSCFQEVFAGFFVFFGVFSCFVFRNGMGSFPLIKGACHVPRRDFE